MVSVAPIFLGIFFDHSFYGMTLAEVVIFHLKTKYLTFHFLDLDGTILNVILPKINEKRQNFHRFLKSALFYPLYDFRILIQIYQSII